MSRLPRIASEGSIYHVIQRGVGQQILFESDSDRKRYLKLAARFLDDLGQNDSLLAWCLMSNHVHLLARMPLPVLSDFMKRLGVGYARYFNATHSRTGHLFQERFKSEPVDDDAYLMTVVRYIHANPVGIECRSAGDYRWSSYAAYMGDRNDGITSTSFVLDVFGGQDEFARFHQSEPQGRTPLDIDLASARPRNDAEALARADSLLGGVNVHEIKSMERSLRNHYIALMRRGELSVRQIARITGIGANIVARVQPEIAEIADESNGS